MEKPIGLSKPSRPLWLLRLETLRLDLILLGVLLVGAGLVYGRCLNPAWFGYYHDDGVYVVTAKALATGQGYRIISLPQELPQTKYPPVYPFLLSLIWRLYPAFPDNIVPMMAFSLGSTLGFLLLAYLYLIRYDYGRRSALFVIVLLTAFNIMTIYFATNLLSDMLYAALSVAALWLVEWATEARTRWGPALLAGLALSLTFLTRQIGVTLIAAAVIYLLWRRRYRLLLAIVAVMGLMIGSWVFWCRIQTRAVVPAGLDYYMNYSHVYLPLFKDYRLFFNIVVKNLPSVLMSSLMIWFPADPTGLGLKSLFGLAFVASGFALLVLGFLRLLGTRLRLLYLYVLFYLGALVLSPFPQQYDRYLVPVLPFVLLPLLSGCEQQWAFVRKLWPNRRNPLKLVMAATSLGLLLVCFTGFFVQNGIFLTQAVRWLASVDLSKDEISKEKLVFPWLREHTGPSDVLATFYDPIYYLYTDRKAIRLGNYTSMMLRLYKEDDFSMRTDELLEILRSNKVRYAIVRPSHPIFKEIATLAGRYPHMFVSVYQSADTATQVYRIEQE